MLTPSKPDGKTRTLAPEGTHVATCVGLIQIGTIEREFKGEKKWVDKLRFTFELPEELHVFKEEDGEKPLVVSAEYSNSMGGKSKLRPIVEGILGVALHDAEAYSYDMEDLLGRSCLISITHQVSKKGNKYVVIKSTSPLLKNMPVPKQLNPTKLLTYEKWNQNYFDSLPDFIKDVMKTSKEYNIMFGTQQKLSEIEEDINPEDIPF